MFKTFLVRSPSMKKQKASNMLFLVWKMQIRTLGVAGLLRRAPVHICIGCMRIGLCYDARGAISKGVIEEKTISPSYR